ncbi:MAG: hypothetical protein K0S33_3748 [Bacteroidetes bacterium]|jgi:hypothetical protein|nr:hypothetical protein [Bacteroidota bacterium]
METTPMPDFTVKQILALKKEGMLSANPEYQRGAVWSENQKKKLIDSVLRGYPLPLIYLHYKKKEVSGMLRESFEIIDGQQRINALYEFMEGAITKLLDPIKDDKIAKFPNFIKQGDCPWANKSFEDFKGDLGYLQSNFLETKLQIVKVITEREDEARDLFIRLQAGLPLNAQEKRDAWPGGYTEFVLKFGGKKEIMRYPGHEFFQKLVERQSTDRGRARQLCAQVGMLFFERAIEGNWLEIGTQALDDYYYKNLDFDLESKETQRFRIILDKLYEIFIDAKRPKFKGHEVIHLVLLVDSLLNDYTRSWEDSFASAFDAFRLQTGLAKKSKKEGITNEYWDQYASGTQTNSDQGDSIKLRHTFFSKKMFDIIQPKLKDSTRGYGELEREILYYKYKKTCQVFECKGEIKWGDLEIHHIDEHHKGGQTTLENGVPVHKACHPKGRGAEEFARKWKEEKEKKSTV